MGSFRADAASLWRTRRRLRGALGGHDAIVEPPRRARGDATPGGEWTVEAGDICDRRHHDDAARGVRSSSLEQPPTARLVRPSALFTVSEVATDVGFSEHKETPKLRPTSPTFDARCHPLSQDLAAASCDPWQSPCATGGARVRVQMPVHGYRAFSDGKVRHGTACRGPRGPKWSDELDSVERNVALGTAGQRPPRVLGVFAHPDDETLCAGGTLAKYASAGADVRVVCLTKGGAGQIRDASVATRATLTAARVQELHAAGKQLGLTEIRVLDHPDGELAHVDRQVLVEMVSGMLGELRPDVVITFGPDGFSGHPDHIAVGAAVTAACYERRSSAPIRLFHCQRPQSRMLLRDRLAQWVFEMTTRFKGTKDFVHAMSVFSREATALGYAADFVNVEWFPSGTYLIEQGAAAMTMYLILSGNVEIRREDENGDVRLLNVLGAGQFVGEEGIATGSPRNAHVVAADDVTTLTFSTSAPVGVDGSGGRVQLVHTRLLPSGDRIDARVDTCVDVSDFVGHKIRATAAHRSQYPIDPSMFPQDMLREMFGVEYFIQVLPEREFRVSLLEDEAGDFTTSAPRAR